jgi:dihydrodipicolinate reductase
MFRSMVSRRFALFMTLNILAFGSVSAAPETQKMPERLSVLVTFGEEECPEPESEDEIVVCAKQPESERYRIPKDLRKTEEELAVDHSWSSTVALHEDAARAGRPNSCSVVGTNGFTGCQSARIRQWFAERREVED